MTVKIKDLSVTAEDEYQQVEAYIFIREGEELTDRVLITTPRLSQNRDSLGGIRPLSILYSQISNDELQWEKRITPYQTTDGTEADIRLITHKLADSEERYLVDTKTCAEILKGGLETFKSDYKYSRISLDNVIETFNRYVMKRETS